MKRPSFERTQRNRNPSLLVSNSQLFLHHIVCTTVEQCLGKSTQSVRAVKFGIGLILLGLGFGVLAMGSSGIRRASNLPR